MAGNAGKVNGRASIPNETRIEDYSVGNSGSFGSVMVKELLSIPAVWAAIREVSETISLLPMEIQDAEGKPVETLLPAEDEDTCECSGATSRQAQSI